MTGTGNRGQGLPYFPAVRRSARTTTEPFTAVPRTVARSVSSPGWDPSVQRVAARPLASVMTRAGPTEPDVAANTTCTSGIALP